METLTTQIENEPKSKINYSILAKDSNISEEAVQLAVEIIRKERKSTLELSKLNTIETIFAKVSEFENQPDNDNETSIALKIIYLSKLPVHQRTLLIKNPEYHINVYRTGILSVEERHDLRPETEGFEIPQVSTVVLVDCETDIANQLKKNINNDMLAGFIEILEVTSQR